MVIRRALAIGWAGLGLGLTLMACTPPAADPTVQATRADHPDEAPAAPRFGPMLFPGERFEAQLSRGVLTVGSLSLQVEAPCQQDGTVLLLARSHAERAGLYGALKPGRVDTVSWLVQTSGMPRWTRSAGETPKRSVELAVTFGRDAYHTTYRSTRQGAPHPPRTQHRSRPLPPGQRVYDGPSALGALRSWSTLPGAQGVLYVVLGRRLWQIELSVGQPATVSLGGERHDAIPIAGTARRLSTKLEPLRRVQRWSLWISDDEQRLPLKAQVELRRGLIDVELTDYELTAPSSERLTRCDAR